MTDLDLSAEDLRRLLRAATDAVEPRADAWERLLPRLVADVDIDGAPGRSPTAFPEAGAAAAAADAAGGAVVIELDPGARRRPRHGRRLPALAASAAAVLLAGLGLAVPRLAGNDLADGGDVPWYVLGDGSGRFRVLSAGTDAVDEPAGSTLLLADEAGTRGYIVRTIVPEPGRAPSPVETVEVAPATTVPGTTVDGVAAAFLPRSVTVNGYDGVVVAGTAGAGTLTWSQDGIEVTVGSFGASTADPAAPAAPATDGLAADELVAVGEGIEVDDEGVPTASFVPPGLRVAAEGENGTVTPRTVYSVDYGAEDLDAPYDDSVSITVSAGGEPRLLPGLLGGTIGLTFRDVEVRGRPAQLGRSTDVEAASAVLTWRESGGVVVSMGALGLSDDELLALANGLRAVDEAAWRDAVGAVLAGAAGASPVEVVVAQGTTAGLDWTVRDPGAPVGVRCLTLSVAGTTDTGGCTDGHRTLERMAEAPTPDGWWVLFAVGDDVAAVTIEGPDGTELDRVPTVDAGAAGRVAVVRLDPEPTDGLVAVARTADGTEVARLAAAGMAPAEVEAAAVADLDALLTAPAVVSGELEGRPWSVRARPVPLVRYRADGTAETVPGDALCATVDFAARRDLGMTCEGEGGTLIAGTLAAGVVDHPRRFLVLLLAPGTEVPTARLDDGTKVAFATAEIADAGGRRVAALAVPLGATVVSVDAGAGAQPVRTPGDPDLEVSFG